jgi:hypothetical protein
VFYVFCEYGDMEIPSAMRNARLNRLSIRFIFLTQPCNMAPAVNFAADPVNTEGSCCEAG